MTPGPAAGPGPGSSGTLSTAPRLRAQLRPAAGHGVGAGLRARRAAARALAHTAAGHPLGWTAPGAPAHRTRRQVACTAARDEQQQAATSTLADLEIAVPADQRPVNELKQLKQAWLYSWATLPEGQYVQRLAGLFSFFALAIGAPISYVTFDPVQDPAEFVLSAAVGALVVVAVACVRIFLGWQYVGQRLFSAAIPYEETGWYDGQNFVKPPEVLSRDRLLGTYEVRPVLNKLRGTLVGSAALLLACSLVLAGLIRAHSDEDGVYGRGSVRTPRQVTATGIIYSRNVRDLSQLANDDQLAAEEAAAMGGVPGYCADRLLRAQAGAMGCPKF